MPRAVCTDCGHVHYENPRVVVGCIVEWEERILLCRRAIQPRRGFWTLPAGFMENGETTAEGAARETFEEARARIVDLQPFALVSVSHIDQVHLFYRGRLADGIFGAGEESLEVALFSEADIPWQHLAFRSGTLCLRRYLQDRAKGVFGFHSADLGPL